MVAPKRGSLTSPGGQERARIIDGIFPCFRIAQRINAAEDFFVRVWHLSVADRSGDAVYLRATGTDHHVLSLHKADKTTLRNITFRANSAGDLERIAAATKAACGTIVSPMAPVA